MIRAKSGDRVVTVTEEQCSPWEAPGEKKIKS
jgi:hypothetical protein